MADIRIDGLTKVYANGFIAVSEVDLHIGDGEFMVLVGPSGCGKTTLLRMIAGLEEITSGDLLIGGRRVNDFGPKARDIAMVFQNYALYPHMSVRDNIGFALKLGKQPKRMIADKVGDTAAILGLTDWLSRRPAQLSGGQRQRVAMGRAIVREPSVFLMDEPLSNLDAKLRVQMRAEVSRIQRRVAVATVYVTHDQVEAMTMGDRVAVMRDGRLQQCAPPQVLYDTPANLFVAAFIGSPAMNLYRGSLGSDGRCLVLGSQTVPLPDRLLRAHPELMEWTERALVVGVRPENLHMGGPDESGQLRAEVELVEALGSELLVHFTIDAERVYPDGTDDAEPGALRLAGGIARVAPRTKVVPRSRVSFTIDAAHLHFFDPATGNAIYQPTPELTQAA